MFLDLITTVKICQADSHRIAKLIVKDLLKWVHKRG